MAKTNGHQNQTDPGTHLKPDVNGSEEDRLFQIEMADVNKLHNEINILVSLRIWVSNFMLGVLASGVILKGPFSFKTLLSCDEAGGELFSIVSLQIITLALWILVISLWKRIRTYSTYLSHYGYSLWEMRWRQFRACTLPRYINEPRQAYAYHARRVFSRIDRFGYNTVFHMCVGLELFMLVINIYRSRNVMSDSGWYIALMVFSIVLALFTAVWMLLTWIKDTQVYEDHLDQAWRAVDKEMTHHERRRGIMKRRRDWSPEGGAERNG